MQAFGSTEVSRLTAIPLHSLRAMVRGRLVAPKKGPRGTLRFSFNDLVLLRTARALIAAGISQRRVGEALRSLREQLPEDLPPRGLSVTATGGRVVVNEAGEKRDAVSGQLLLAFEVRIEGARVELIDTVPQDPVTEAQDTECENAFAAALQLEDMDVDAAIESYRACVARHSHDGARANLGRLLHLQGRISEALEIYLQADPSNIDVLYNQAVALEDLGQTSAAIATYLRVLDIADDYTDAHHNVARLLQQVGKGRQALRHWNAYRKLTRPSDAG